MKHWVSALRAALLLAAVALLPSASFAESSSKHFSDAQRAEIGDVVRSYLVEHPEVLIDAMNALQDKQDKAAKAKAEAIIKSRPNDIYNDGYSFVAGNPKAKITVVEFFDYNCSYCRKAFDKMMTLAGPNSKVRFVFKEYPILSAESEVASRAALAAKKQGKYLEFHRGLMSHSGRANKAAIDDVAKKIGLNMSKFRKDMDDPSTLAHVEKNLKLGDDLGLDGTPSFIVDGKVIGGWSEKDVEAAINGNKG